MSSRNNKNGNSMEAHKIYGTQIRINQRSDDSLDSIKKDQAQTSLSQLEMMQRLQPRIHQKKQSLTTQHTMRQNSIGNIYKNKSLSNSISKSINSKSLSVKQNQ